MTPKLPLSEREKYNAAWHFLQAAKTTLPSSGSVSVGPPLAQIEETQDEILERRDMIPEVADDGV